MMEMMMMEMMEMMTYDLLMMISAHMYREADVLDRPVPGKKEGNKRSRELLKDDSVIENEDAVPQAPVVDMAKLDEDMQRAVSFVNRELGKMRIGRLNPGTCVSACIA
jgi:hypothetical protein